MDYSITTTSGKVTFLVLWHFWANSFAGVAASHGNVDHVLCCVQPHRGFKVFEKDWALCLQVSFYLFPFICKENL